MPRVKRKDETATRARAPAGKKQTLVIMDADVVRQVKVAAAEDERKMSHIVEEAVKDWLARRKSQK